MRHVVTLTLDTSTDRATTSSAADLGGEEDRASLDAAGCEAAVPETPTSMALKGKVSGQLEKRHGQEDREITHKRHAQCTICNAESA